MKKITKLIASLCLIFALSVTFCACGDEDHEDNDSFDFYNTKIELETMDTNARGFLNNLQLQKSNDELLMSYIKNVKDYMYSAIVILKNWDTFLDNTLSYDEDDQEELNNSISETNTSFSMVSDKNEIKFETAENFKFFSFTSKSNNSNILVEYIKLKESNYAIQIVNKDFGSNQYNIFQILFEGYSGKFVIDNNSSVFVSIFGTDLNSSNFPTEYGDYIYSN